jgi:hypothetical protein
MSRRQRGGHDGELLRPAQHGLEDPRPRDEVVVGQEARAHAVAASMAQAGCERAMSEEVDDGGAEGHEVDADRVLRRSPIPASNPHHPPAVEVRETHASRVFQKSRGGALLGSRSISTASAIAAGASAGPRPSLPSASATIARTPRRPGPADLPRCDHCRHRVLRERRCRVNSSERF